MRLPPNCRTDLLEFVGATPVADLQLELLIDMLALSGPTDLRFLRSDPPAAGEPAPRTASLN